jgi:hypothetical protein
MVPVLIFLPMPDLMVMGFTDDLIINDILVRA